MSGESIEFDGKREAQRKISNCASVERTNFFCTGGYTYIHISKRRKVLISLREDLLRSFREFLALKYGRYEKGLLSYEMEQAIRNWLSLHYSSLHAKTQNDNALICTPNPPFKVAERWNRVKLYFNRKNVPLLSGVNITIDELHEAIQATIGHDERTIRKYIELFQRFGLIKHIAGKVWEVL